MILAAVMLLVALGALTSVGVLFRSSAEQFTVSASGRAGRARAMARSGLASVQRELELQRLDIFAGKEPMLLGELSLEQADGRTGVVRIVPVRRRMAVPESAKININHSSVETLGRLALVGPDLASRIVAARPFASVDELLRVDGVTPELLYGDLRSLLAQASSDEGGAVDETGGAGALRDVLTVHGFWPPIQLGVGNVGSRFAGERKINLNREWSDDLGDEIAKRYTRAIADGVRTLMDRGIKFGDERQIVNIIMQVDTDTSDWDEILDAFCASDEAALAGRVDLSRATPEVLAALPGLDETSAASICSLRETVDPESLLSVAWPVTSGAINGRTLAACIDSIAPSGAQWRVVIEAGFLPPGVEDTDDGVVLESRVVLEAVIDLSSPRARLAELTDITNLPLSIAWRLEGADDDDGSLDESLADDEDANRPEGDTLGVEVPWGTREDQGTMTPDSDNTMDAQPTPDRRVGRFRVRGAGGGGGGG